MTIANPNRGGHISQIIKEVIFLCTYILQGAYKNYFFDNLTDVAATIGISYRHLLRL
jgi:hypothetical protein